MDRKDNPFKVPENNFSDLNAHLQELRRVKPVSSQRMYRWVASVSAAVVVGLGVWLVASQDTIITLRQDDSLSFIFNKESHREKVKAEKEKAEQLAWQQKKTELREQAEQIEFTEEEEEFLDYFSEDEDLATILSNTDIEL